jgi:hypothetical protein
MALRIEDFSYINGKLKLGQLKIESMPQLSAPKGLEGSRNLRPVPAKIDDDFLGYWYGGGQCAKIEMKKGFYEYHQLVECKNGSAYNGSIILERRGQKLVTKDGKLTLTLTGKGNISWMSATDGRTGSLTRITFTK